MLEWLSTKLDNILTWFKDVIVLILQALGDVILDVFVKILDLFLSAITGLLSLIPVPGFLSSGLSSFVATLPPSVLWAMGSFGIPEALALIGAAVLFRLSRKLLTLGQW
jgi:hypothetical protein